MIKNSAEVKKYLAIYAGVATVIFFAAMFLFTGKHLSAPLDDAFIYFQYAKNTAQGNFFEYVRGEGYSSGATSFLYAFILVPFALFLKGSYLIFVTYLIGGVSLYFSGYYIYKIVEKLSKSHLYAVFAALLYITNGNILWGYFSGMEIAPFATLLVASLYYLMFADKIKQQATSLSLLALIRPEGFAVVIMVAFLKVISRVFNKKEKFAFLIIPLAVGFSYFLTNYLFTGDFMPNTMRSKSNFSLYYFSYTDMIAQGWNLYFDFLRNIFNGEKEHYFLRYTYFAFLLGVLPGAFNELKNRKLGPYLIGFFWFFIGVMSTVFSSFATVHNYRYTMPFVVLYVVFSTMGIFFVVSKFKFVSKKQEKTFIYTLMSLFLVFNSFTIAGNIINFGRDCRDIYAQSISAGKWLKENIKEDAVIAINDAGALAYYSGKRVFDLVGLVTNGQSIIFKNGKPGVFEELENVRPDYFLIHIGWFNYEPYTLLGPRLTEFNIKREPAYYVVGSPEVCVPLVTTLLGSGDTMKDNHVTGGFKEIDKIDVCDYRNEEKHHYSIWSKFVSERPGTMLEEAPHKDSDEIILDGGRITNGGEKFTVSNVQPGDDMKIVKRTFNAPRNVVMVKVDGTDAGEWVIEEQKGYSEAEYKIKGDLFKDSKAIVELEVKSKNRYNTFYYWFLQKAR